MKTLFTLALLTVGLFSFDQSANDAKQLLEEVKENLLNFSDQKILFTNTIDFPTGDANNPRRTRESSGQVIVVGDRYKIEIGGQSIIINSNRAYIVSPDDEEVDVRILEDEDMAFTPNGIISRFENGSSLALAGKEVIDGKTIQYVKVRPNGSERIRDIVLGINVSTKRVYSYTEYSTDDVVTKYVINTYTVNSGIPASEVTFNRDDYAGWRINEPRSQR